MKFSPAEKGQGLVEYAIIIVFVAIVLIVIVGLFGVKVGNTFSSINSTLP
jgi:pilus assembly protein Flp/PilA